MMRQDNSRSLAEFEATFRHFRDRTLPPTMPSLEPLADRPARRGAALQLVERVFD